jgi:hypothetical protein
MDINEFLLGLAGVAVSLAGFSGLVIAIRTSASATWQPRDIWSLSWMLGASIGALFMALLPPLLSLFALSEAQTWRMASLVMALFMISLATSMAVYDRRLTRQGHLARVRYFPSLVFSLFMICGGLALAVAGGWLQDLRIAILVLGLVASLMASALALVVFLVILAREASAP